MTFAKSERKRFVETLNCIASKPSMYLSDPTYWGFCSYIEGFDLAYEGAVLCGFSEWRKQHKLPGNLGWSAAFLETVFPHAKSELSPQAQKQAMQELAILLESILVN